MSTDPREAQAPQATPAHQEGGPHAPVPGPAGVAYDATPDLEAGEPLAGLLAAILPPGSAGGYLAARRAVMDAIRPLFRHGGGGGATGFSVGWNADAGGYGAWNHHTSDWFDHQTFPADIKDFDALAFFADRVLRALGVHPPSEDQT